MNWIRMRGFTYVEVMLAVVILSVAVVATVYCVQVALLQQKASRDITTACHLAQEIREITLDKAFLDPDQTPVYGPEAGETFSDFDDIDDYHKQVISPPVLSDMSRRDDLPGWSQRVVVEYVDASDLKTVVGAGTSDYVRVTVRVYGGEQKQAELKWIVTKR